MQFKGRLTVNAIAALNVIIRVPSETTKMTLMGWSKLLMPHFYMSMSTDEHPMHMKCPEHNPPDKN